MNKITRTERARITRTTYGWRTRCCRVARERTTKAWITPPTTDDYSVGRQPSVFSSKEIVRPTSRYPSNGVRFDILLLTGGWSGRESRLRYTFTRDRSIWVGLHARMARDGHSVGQSPYSYPLTLSHSTIRTAPEDHIYPYSTQGCMRPNEYRTASIPLLYRTCPTPMTIR